MTPAHRPARPSTPPASRRGRADRGRFPSPAPATGDPPPSRSRARTAASLAAAVALLLAGGAVLAPAAAQEAADAPEATPEAVRALFPDAVGGMTRSSLRAGYNDAGYAAAEAEYGSGAEGPVGGGPSGTGVSLHAGLEDPTASQVEGLVARVRSRGGVTDTTYRGHQAHWLELGPGVRGAVVLTGTDPRAVATAVVSGEGGPTPGQALAALDVDGLAAMAEGYAAPSFRTVAPGAEPSGRARAEGEEATLTVARPEGWTVQELTEEVGDPYLLVSREPVDRHLLLAITNREERPTLGGNVVVQASVAFARQGLVDAAGRFHRPTHLFEELEAVHDWRRVRVEGAEGMEWRGTAVDLGGTAYRHRQLVVEAGGRLLFVQTLVPEEAGEEVTAAVEALVASVALEAGPGG